MTDKKAIEWHKKNKWFGRDKHKTIIAMTLHEMLVKKGVNPKTKAYYEYIDEFMGTFKRLMRGIK